MKVEMRVEKISRIDLLDNKGKESMKEGRNLSNIYFKI